MSPGAVKGGRQRSPKALRRQKILAHLLPSRLYCRYRNRTGSCARGARGLYRRSGISPCPEDICSLFSFRERQYTTIPPKMQGPVSGQPYCAPALGSRAKAGCVRLAPIGLRLGCEKGRGVPCRDGHTLFAFPHTTCLARQRPSAWAVVSLFAWLHRTSPRSIA